MEKESQAKKQFCLANDCTKILPKSRRKYCSDKCARRIKQRAYRAKKTASEYHIEKDIDHNIQKRRGRYYAIMEKKNFFDSILNGSKSKQEIADILGCSLATITRSLSAYLKDQALKDNQKILEDNPEAKAALDDFILFRDTYFLTEQGVL